MFQILCNLCRRSFCFRLALDGRQTEVPLVYWKNGPTRIGAFGLWSDRDDFFFHTNTLYFEAVPDPENINLAAKTSVWWDNEFPNIIGFWGTLSVGTKPVIEVMYYIYKISSNITIQLCFICHPKKIWTSLNIHMVFDFDHFSRESHLSQSSQSLCSTEDSFGAYEFLDPAQRAAPRALLVAPRSLQSPRRRELRRQQPWKPQCRGCWNRGLERGAGNPRIMTA